MRRPDLITFTGADARTDIGRMAVLSARYPIEWGILFSPTRQGGDNRYPNDLALASIVVSGMRLAAHLCGGYGRAVMDTVRPCILFLDDFQRIQVNHRNPIPESMIATLGAENVIAQTRGEFPDDDRVEWLFDRSGGRGAEPDFWPSYPGRYVGYAGGIGPDNVLGVIDKIAADGPYWIDMETKVRTDDWFDLGLCERVCQLVYDQ